MEQITADNIQKYVDKITLTNSKYRLQKAYYDGNNVAILQPQPKPDPDYRKPIPFARRGVNVVVGYMAKPGNIRYSGDFYTNNLKSIFFRQDEDLITANELEDCLIYGTCYELHWMEDGEKNFEPIPVWQGYPIYDNGIRPKLVGFVWAREIDELTMLATYYDEKFAYKFQRGEDGKWITLGSQPHGYNTVPVNIGKINRDKSNLFDHIIPLIDLYDKLISEDVANEAARFNAALLLMAERIDAVSQDESGRTAIDRLKELRLIDDLGDGDVKQKVGFIQRDIPTGFIEYATNTVERLVYEMLQIVNPNDDNFATASGVAQAYKLLGMEYLCASIEAYFTKFLQARIRLIAGISQEMLESTDGANEVTIKFDRNLPHNLKEISEVIAMLKGTLSDETLLKLLPAQIVPDVQEELKRIEAAAPDINLMEQMTEPAEDEDETDDEA